MTPTRFIPQPILDGGSLIGTSYVGLFHRCLRKWFNQHKRPHLEGTGIVAKHTSEHLIKGSTFHEGIAALYLSGCRDGEDTGEWDIDRAVDVMEVCHHKREHEYANPETATNDLKLLREMLRPERRTEQRRQVTGAEPRKRPA